jgi:hypothetical protein
MNILLDRTAAVGRGEPAGEEEGPVQLPSESFTWGGRELRAPAGTAPFSGQHPQRGAEKRSALFLLSLTASSLLSGLRLLGLVLSPAGLSRTYGGRSALRDEAVEGWAMKNNRRLFLIDKKYGAGLGEGEAAELALLQEETARSLDAVAPLPLGALEQLEALAERLEGEAGQ